MSEFKKIYASIYLENEKATKSLKSSDYLAESPVELAIRYSNDNVDGIIVFDKSPSGDDKAHEKALDIIKDICKKSDCRNGRQKLPRNRLYGRRIYSCTSGRSYGCSSQAFSGVAGMPRRILHGSAGAGA